MSEILTGEVKEKLSKIGYTVKPKAFRNTFYKDETEPKVWIEMCEIAGVSPNVNQLTLLSVAYLSED